jgi:hypothetical protein
MPQREGEARQLRVQMRRAKTGEARGNIGMARLFGGDQPGPGFGFRDGDGQVVSDFVHADDPITPPAGSSRGCINRDRGTGFEGDMILPDDSNHPGETEGQGRPPGL